MHREYRRNGSPGEVKPGSHNMRRIRIDPQQNPLEQAIQPERRKPTTHTDQAKQTHHMRVKAVAVAAQRLKTRHMGHGRDELVAGRAHGVFKSLVDLADSHAAQLERVDGVDVRAALPAIVRGGDEQDGVEGRGVCDDEGEEAGAEEVADFDCVESGDLDCHIRLVRVLGLVISTCSGVGVSGWTHHDTWYVRMPCFRVKL